jgi:hypothetical protein
MTFLLRSVVMFEWIDRSFPADERAKLARPDGGTASVA